MLQVSGSYEKGDIRPLEPLKRLGGSESLVDIVRIKGTADYPLSLKIIADVGAVGTERALMRFELSSHVVINLQGLGVPLTTLRVQGIGELRTSPPGLIGGFFVEIAELSLAGLGRMEAVAVSFSTMDVLYAEVIKKQRFISRGMGLYCGRACPPSRRCAPRPSSST